MSACRPIGLLDARANFVATPQLRLVLDDAGLAQVIPAIA
jgi:putative DNA primase/helicase